MHLLSFQPCRQWPVETMRHAGDENVQVNNSCSHFVELGFLVIGFLEQWSYSCSQWGHSFPFDNFLGVAGRSLHWRLCSKCKHKRSGNCVWNIVSQDWQQWSVCLTFRFTQLKENHVLGLHMNKLSFWKHLLCVKQSSQCDWHNISLSHVFARMKGAIDILWELSILLMLYFCSQANFDREPWAVPSVASNRDTFQ